MGQKLSDLKGVIKTMEDRPDNEIQISLERVHFCPNESDARINSSVNINESDNNGNAEVSSRLNEHFEHIYNTSENKDAEDNGNRVQPSTSEGAHSLPASTSFCSNSQRNENSGFFSSETRKSKSRGNKKSSKSKESGSTKKKRPHWVLRFNCARLKSGSNSSGGSSEPEITEPNVGITSCICTGYRRTEENHLEAGVLFEAAVPRARRSSGNSSGNDSDDGLQGTHAIIDFTDRLRYRGDEFAIEDCDERARLERAREIAEGMDPPPGFRPGQHIQLVCQEMILDSLTALLQSAAISALSQLNTSSTVHTQVDYIHCLVPDLLQITTCSFYWGKMDRYEAERLLDGKPEGTFLLRDSAQEEYLFSVSFRKYGRSLHARIEQWKHMFSFDSHDPGVFSSPTVCGLIKHYKDPTCCMYFEPTLTIPLHRNFSFPLQHLCRAVICSKISYDGISQLRLPKSLKTYLKEYHYKQRVKVRVFDSE